MKVIGFVFVAWQYLVFASGMAYAQDDANANSEHFIVGGNYDYPPYEFINEKGVPTGYSTELTYALAAVMGVRVEVFLDSWKKTRHRLETGKIDAIHGMYYSKERDKLVDFSPPHTIINNTIFTRVGLSKIRSLEELSGKQLIVVEKGVLHDYMKKSGLAVNLILTDSDGAALRLVSSGKYDYALLGELPGLYLSKKLQLSNVTPAGPSILPFEYCYAVKEGNLSLLSRINEGLAILKHTGRYKEIYDQWLGVYEPKSVWGLKSPKNYKFALMIVTTVLLLLVAGLLWVKTLRKQVSERTIKLNREVQERKLAQRDLLKSEETYRSLIEEHTDLVCRFSADGTLNFVSDAFCRFFGKSQEELVGTKWTPLPLDEDIAMVKEKLATLSPSNRTVVVENRVISGKGDIHWMHFVNKSFYDRDGNLSGIQSVGRDITEIKKALKKINQQNLILEAINKIFIEAMKCDSVKAVAKMCLSVAEEITSSEFGSIAEVNERGKFNTIALSNPGWHECEFIESDHDYIIQDMEIRGIWGAALNSNEGIIIKDPANHPLSVGIPEGHPPLNSFIGVPFQHEKIRGVIGLANKESEYTQFEINALRSLVVAFVEVIERKRAEEALRLTEKRYRQAQRIGKVGDFTWDTGTDEVTWSESSFELFHYNVTDKIDYELVKNNLHHPDDLEGIHQWLEACIASGTGVLTPHEYRIVCKDGEIIHVRTLGVIEHEAGKAPKVFGTVQDINDRKQMEEEKAVLESQLFQSQKLESIGNLAGGIAHDFNNILSAVIGFTELALDDAKNDAHLVNNLQEVYAAGKRAKELVKQILTFARQTEVEVKPILIKTIMKEAIKLIRSTTPTTIDIQQHIDSDSLIMGNSIEIHQIVMNLCTNAAYAMDEKGGTLRVDLKDVHIERGSAMYAKVAKVGDFIEIKISDTGVGIPKDIIHSIFEPYFTTKALGEGTGMGLAVVHGIVEKSGGKIAVDSQIGQGSVFSVYLPITAKKKIHKPYTPERLPTGSERILFVDDEPPIIKMGRLALERLGYKVTVRTCSVEALKLFHSTPNNFDLVMTDMTMPKMTGDQLAFELLKIRPNIPIILCTGYSKKISDVTASEIGIKALAYKPFIKAELAKTVRNVLDMAENPAKK